MRAGSTKEHDQYLTGKAPVNCRLRRESVVRGLLHGRKSISRHCIRNSSLSFARQSRKLSRKIGGHFRPISRPACLVPYIGCKEFN